MEEDAAEYELHISSSKTPNEPPKVMYQIDMRSAVIYDYWDIVVMQDGVFEIAQSSSYTLGNAQKLQQFVEENRLNTRVNFAWHMTWVAPTDNTLRDKYPYEPNTYYSNYERYNHDRSTVYKAVAKCVEDHVMNDESFEFVIPSATAFENALSSYLEETDLHRDYVHATDLGRVIASYTWYCKLMGIEKLEEIKLSSIPVKFLNSTSSTTDVVLTDMEKVFGNKTEQFRFDDSGIMSIEEGMKKFTDGLSSEQKKVFKGVKKVLTSRNTTSVVYADEYELTINNGQLTIFYFL